MEEMSPVQPLPVQHGSVLVHTLLGFDAKALMSAGEGPSGRPNQGSDLGEAEGIRIKMLIYAI